MATDASWRCFAGGCPTDAWSDREGRGGETRRLAPDPARHSLRKSFGDARDGSADRQAVLQRPRSLAAHAAGARPVAGGARCGGRTGEDPDAAGGVAPIRCLPPARWARAARRRAEPPDLRARRYWAAAV